MSRSRDAHKNDPGIYQITYFDELGRKIDQTLMSSFLDAVNACTEWKTSSNGGSAVVHRCVYNSELVRPTYAPDMQY